MAAKAHILVVDDEAELRETIAEYLCLHGYEVTTADGGAEARKQLAEKRVDLVLLDLHMPGEDGLSLTRHLREHWHGGIIMVTAAGEVVDRIVGLEVGADDYVGKPFDLRELLARVKSVLRRLAAGARHADAPPTDNSQCVCFAGFTLDLGARKLWNGNGSEVPLTGMEFDLLKAFATHPNRVLNRDQLLELAHNRAWDPFDRSIDVRITRLRRKIETDPARPQIIKTVRGTGYVFASRINQ